jgi:branched-chain amino acid transport system substrate-binding protein
VKKLAVIQQDNDLGVSAKAALDSQVPKHPGLQIVANETTQAGNTEVSSAVNKVVAAQPDAVLLAEDNTSVALILKALRAQGFTGPVFADQGGAGTGGTSTVGPAGAAAEGFLAGMQADTVSTNNPTWSTGGAWRRPAASHRPRAASRCRPTASSGRSPNWSSAWARTCPTRTSPRPPRAEVEPDQAGFHPRHRVRPTARRPHLRRTGGIAKFAGGKWTVEQPFTGPQ